MNLYDKTFNYLIEDFKGYVAALTLNKDNVNMLEQIADTLNYNGILCTGIATAHSHDKTLSAIIYIRKPDDSDVLRALATTCAFLDVKHDAIEPCFNIENRRYGYSVNGKDGMCIVVSLYNIRKEYSPLDIERLLKDFRSSYSEVFFAHDHGVEVAV